MLITKATFECFFVAMTHRNGYCFTNGATGTSNLSDASDPQLTDSIERDYFTPTRTNRYRHKVTDCPAGLCV